MTRKKSKELGPERRPFRLQVYLTESEGDRLSEFASAMDITNSLAARELIMRGIELTEQEEKTA